MSTISARDRRPDRVPPEMGVIVGAGGEEIARAFGPRGWWEERTAQLSLLVEVNAALAGAVDVEAVLGTILERLVERQGLSHAAIYRWDGPSQKLQPVAMSGGSVNSWEAAALAGPTLAAWAVQHGEAVYVPETGKDPRCQGRRPAIHSEYAVPLLTGARVLGVLDVGTGRPDGIRAVSRKLLDQVATQAALALERSELSRQLRASEERFRSIFEQGSLGVALADLEGRLTTINPALAALLGYAPQELLGRKFPEITHPDDLANVQKHIAALRDGRLADCTLEERLLHRSGQGVWCSSNITLLHDAAGRPAQFLTMIQDIEDQKKAEEDRARLQQQLFQAQKMEALGTLAGGIAHDFNNLLSVMLGFASLARQHLSPDDPLQEPMGMIEQSAQRAAELTRQLLGFARPERHEVNPVGVREVLDRVGRMVTRTFDRSIRVITKKANEAWCVQAEPSYLEQALLNLCINARDAMPGGGTLTLEAAAVTFESPPPELLMAPALGQYVAITVQDTGVGMEPEVLPRIFDPFFTTKEPGRGTGLGLAMVYGFAKNHGGFVQVESAPRKGARFTLHLPLLSAPAPEAKHAGPRSIPRGSGTVLVVDDEPLVRAFAERGLEGLGYKVFVAENGRQAVELYEQHGREIDCVLLDLIMPEMGGIEAYRHLRQLNPQVRVVFASGYSTGGSLTPEAREAAFLGKPYSLEGLSNALRKLGIGAAGET